MAITAVRTVNPRPGGYQRVRQGMEELKTIVEKQGVDVKMIRPVTGDHQGNLSLVTVFENWAAFGAASEKIRSSSGYQALMKRAVETEDPAVESISTQFYEDVE